MPESSPKTELRKTVETDLETLFNFQLDDEYNCQAAFTATNYSDKKAYLEKWTRHLTNPSIHSQTILVNGEIAGSVAKYEMDGEPQITYGIGKQFWGKGIATQALQAFLKLEKTRPIFGRTAFDNSRSERVLQKCGFEKIGTEISFANAREKEIEEFIFKLS